MDITVITPTYNRGEKLRKLYESLISQTCMEFEWLIIDDGSTDNTEKIAKNFIDEKKIKIKYFKKQNGGKHTALNLGMNYVETDLTFIVDSDDWLKNDAIENISKIHDKYKSSTNICGYSFLRQYPDGKINGIKLEENEIVGNYINIRINGNDMNADKAEVWKTSALKECPFPEFENEKFLGEDVVWMQLARKYDMVFLNKEIYVSDYLNDGLTKNRRKNNIKSPKGCCYRAQITLECCEKTKMKFKHIVKCILQHQIYGRFAKEYNKMPFKRICFKLLYVLLYPISILIYLKWKNDFYKENKDK